MSQHILRIGGREYRAEVKELTPDRATVEVDGKEYLVDLVQLGRRKVTAEAVRPASLPVAVANVPVVHAPRPAAAAGGGGIPAPMPGLVLSLKAKEGDTVQAGQTVLIIEAMKMENAIAAPYQGTVSKIYVREGDSVGEGDLLVDVARPKMTTL
ncbi:MAG TPA: biotin/lipoyl-containing protein [Vicinamibacterales bacterium]|nr:biotin/lipoyl-containing protein [Vicinamibacterales bacterium]